MPAPDSVLSLVERFREHRDEYLSAGYNEATLRKEFLEPMFSALGWDVDNTKGYAEAYKEVIHEDAIKISGATKAPDYAFRLGGVRKFFVEAKKPSVDVKGDPSPAYQLRRYAWSAKLPLSILTDFHEFAVYDCTKKPDLTDTAAACRILYLTCDDYAKRWEEIAELFSPEAIQKGAFDKHAASAKRKGTTTVDDAFLKEIETWRDLLAHNLALRNPGLTQRELNTAVQTTIDRIIFLRICEDRGIEEYGVLRGLVNGTCIYARMLGVFRAADERYNSGLFHFRSEKDRPGEPDTLTLGLVIDDKALKEILEALYYPKSPYEFSVLPADILGHVYEQFLGKVIRLTAGHHAVVEEKPEVKKAGGVYYTPTYIVDYIVKNTVGKLLEGMTPKEANSLRVLDPACGSGSFLLAAYQLLLDWHQAWYAGHDPEKWARGRGPRIFRGQDAEWRLTTAERKRILIDCIYGVDIDPQAVEVTKLSLLLKVLEGEDAESIGKTLKLLRERALPDLGKNIQCGNSLIGTDFYDEHLIDALTEEERYRINAFDWEVAFPEIMTAGGFDVVIGNPPYGGVSQSQELRYVSSRYHCQDYQKDLYLLFLERYAHLLKEGALLGVIVSNTWLQSVTLRKIRQHLSAEYQWLRVLLLADTPFRAVVDTHVLVFEKRARSSRGPREVEVDVRSGNEIALSHRLAQATIPTGGDPINVSAPPEYQRVVHAMQSRSTPLRDICRVFNGVKPFEKGKGTPPQTEAIVREKPYVCEGPRPDSDWSPLLRGSLIQRYQNLWKRDYWIQYGSWLAAPRDPAIFEALQKLVVRQTGDSIIATMIPDGFIARNNLHVLLPRCEAYDLRYILGILNSKGLDFIYTFMNPEKGEALAEVKKQHVELLAIPSIDFGSEKGTQPHGRMVALVDQMLSLNVQLMAAKTDHEKSVFQRQIDATVRKIDELVYVLYGLTDDEILIVEEATR
jgi:hypothetical protein